MSLVQHLARGELADWFADRGRDLRKLAGEVAEKAGGYATVRPRRRDLPVEHYATVGGIVGQRLADAVHPAPPYAALLGAIRCGAISVPEAGHQACRYPTHDLDEQHQDQALFWRPTPTGWWKPWPDQHGPTVAGDEPVREILRQAHQVTTGHIPAQLGSRQAEADALVPYYGLALCENVYRSGQIPDALQQLSDTGQNTVKADIASDVLAVLAHNRTALQQASRLGTSANARQFGFASPTIIPGWADADLVLGPDARDNGYSLIDVKTVSFNRADDVDRVLLWIWQVMAYALLDTTDRWRIRRLGLWLPRQGLLVGWPVEQVLDCLRGDLPMVRADVVAIASRGIRADGGDPSVLSLQA